MLFFRSALDFRFLYTYGNVPLSLFIVFLCARTLDNISGVICLNSSTLPINTLVVILNQIFVTAAEVLTSSEHNALLCSFILCSKVRPVCPREFGVILLYIGEGENYT